jgi:hypothetical protein
MNIDFKFNINDRVTVAKTSPSLDRFKGKSGTILARYAFNYGGSEDSIEKRYYIAFDDLKLTPDKFSDFMWDEKNLEPEKKETKATMPPELAAIEQAVYTAMMAGYDDKAIVNAASSGVRLALGEGKKTEEGKSTDSISVNELHDILVKYGFIDPEDKLDEEWFSALVQHEDTITIKDFINKILG